MKSAKESHKNIKIMSSRIFDELNFSMADKTKNEGKKSSLRNAVDDKTTSFICCVTNGFVNHDNSNG